jgi:hypothetical protein
MTYDLIIVSKSVGNLIQVTQNCIDSARKDNAELNIIIVETNSIAFNYDVDKIVKYEGEFNYNRALNLGLKYAKSDVQILANNDIIFHPGWSQIGDIMKINNYLSSSAMSNAPQYRRFRRGMIAYEGYGIGFELAGWCIFTRKELWEQIDKLDEKHPFWFSDNAYADQLKAKNIKHALICCVRVDHITSATFKKMDKVTQKKFRQPS